MKVNMIELDPNLVADLEAIETEVITVEHDDPLDNITLDQVLAGHKLRRDDQTARTLTKNKAVYRHPDAVKAEREARQREIGRRQRQRHRAAAKRVKRQEAQDAKPIDYERIRAVLDLLGGITHVIANLTLAYYNRYRRVLGDTILDDITQDATLRIAEALCKSDTDLTVLTGITDWLAHAPQPYDGVDGPQGASRLLGTLVTVIRRTITDTYRANTSTAWVLTLNEDGKEVYQSKRVPAASLDDLLDTVAYSTRTSVDEFIARATAQREPQRTGSAPGMRDKRLFARAVIDAAINARGLSWLATMLLNPDHLRTDGAFKWAENAERIWMGLGLPMLMVDDRRVMADYAKRATVIAFGFLPDVIEAAYQIIHDPVVMWSIDSTVDNELVRAAAKYRPIRYPVGETITKDAMDGGVSLARTVELMDDPDAVRRALDIIYHQEA